MIGGEINGGDRLLRKVQSQERDERHGKSYDEEQAAGYEG
jgi:hypothetical protein